MIRRGNMVAIEVEATEAPYRYHGEFKAQDEEYVKIKSTSGENIGKDVLVPKRVIKNIVIVSSREV